MYLSVSVKVILISLYFICATNNLFATNDKDMETGLSGLSLNAENDEFHAVDNKGNEQNDSLEFNHDVGAVAGRCVVTSRKDVLKEILKDIFSYNIITIPITIKKDERTKQIDLTCNKCGKKFITSELYGARSAYFSYHLAANKKDCMFDSQNKPYAHIIFFYSIDNGSNSTEEIRKFNIIVSNPCSIDVVLNDFNNVLEKGMRFADSLLRKFGSILAIENNRSKVDGGSIEIMENNVSKVNSDLVVMKGNVGQVNSSSVQAVVVNDSLMGNSKYQNNSFINEKVICEEYSVPRKMDSVVFVADNLDFQVEANTSQEVMGVRYPEYTSMQSRMDSFAKCNSTKPKPIDLAKAGYFYTGDNDAVRCFCCDLVIMEWDITSDVWKEHARHSPECLFLKQEKGDRYIADIRKEWCEIYKPKNPQYEEIESRRLTYDGVWPIDIEQKPKILAEAGFYYSCEGNNAVRCHYCDLGIVHFEPGDDPWECHALFFPSCMFLRKMKGCKFIDNIISADTLKTEQESMSEILNGFVMSKESKDLENSPEFETNKVIQVLIDAGFNKHLVACAIIEYRKYNTDVFFSIEEVQEIINKKSESMKDKFKVIVEKPVEPNIKELREENIMLREKNKCMKCRNNEINTIFKKCGHRVVCEKCSTLIKKCPECNKKVKKSKILKSYLSSIDININDKLKKFILPGCTTLDISDSCKTNIIGAIKHNADLAKVPIIKASTATLSRYIASNCNTKSSIYKRKRSFDHYSTNEQVNYREVYSASIPKYSKVKKNKQNIMI